MRLEISPRHAAGSAFRRARAAALATSVGLGLVLAPAAWAQTASPAPLLQPQERVAVDGAHKVPALRNVELTAPYFHNGGMATLEQVKAFAKGGSARIQR